MHFPLCNLFGIEILLSYECSLVIDPQVYRNIGRDRSNVEYEVRCNSLERLGL